MSSTEMRTIEWFSPIDYKMHSCRITQGEEDLDLSAVLNQMSSIIKQNESKCKSIFYLGVALTGTDEGAYGFLDGWLMRSIKDSIETDTTKWNICHDTKELSKEEVKKYYAKVLRDAADRIESNESFSPKNIPIVKNRDGTDLFE